MTTATPKIALAGVHKAFGRKQVLRGVDLSIDAGSSLVVIGGSGTGEIGVDQVDPRHHSSRQGLDPHRRPRDHGVWVPATAKRSWPAMGMLFQGGALFDQPARLAERRLRPDPGQGYRPAQGAGDCDREAVAGGPGCRCRGTGPGRTVGRHAEARRPGPGDRPPIPTFCSSTSRPPDLTRSWPT